jgi:hypothetical protein
LSAVGQLLKDEGQAIVIAHIRELLLHILFAAYHFVIQKPGLDGTDTVQAPAGGGQGHDQIAFDAGCGLKVVDVGV